MQKHRPERQDRKGTEELGTEGAELPVRSSPAPGEIPKGAYHHQRRAIHTGEHRAPHSFVPAAAQKEAKALDEENFVFSNRAQDLLHRAIENLNADGRYKLIVNANALLDADSTLDITPAVLQEVNRLYALEKKDKDKK